MLLWSQKRIEGVDFVVVRVLTVGFTLEHILKSTARDINDFGAEEEIRRIMRQAFRSHQGKW